MNIQSYLERIKHDEVTHRDLATLSQLQMNHLLHVPFENLDVMRKVEIPLDVQTYYRKIVENRRGGFCYELNGLFHWLLTNLGYEAQIISATVKRGDGSWTMEGSHAALIVELEQPYYVDVGFGDSARRPLPLTGETRRDVSGAYRINPAEGDSYDLQQMGNDHEWRTRMRFTLTPKQLSDFKEPCHFNQTSPQSNFTHGELATIATEEGRITFSKNKLTETSQGEKVERPLQNEEKAAVLQRYFGIVNLN